jgi:hypothetical protein
VPTSTGSALPPHSSGAPRAAVARGFFSYSSVPNPSARRHSSRLRHHVPLLRLQPPRPLLANLLPHLRRPPRVISARYLELITDR